MLSNFEAHRPCTIDGLEVLEVAAELSKHVRGEVRFDDGSRALYATDSSNHRQLPIGDVLPKRTLAREAAAQHEALRRSAGGDVVWKDHSDRASLYGQFGQGWSSGSQLFRRVAQPIRGGGKRAARSRATT